MNRQLLLTALNELIPGLALTELVDSSSDYIFLKNKIATFNDEIYARINFKHEINGTINGKRLIQLLSRITKENIDLQIIDNTLILKAGRTKATLIVKPLISLLLNDIEQPKNWSNIKNSFNADLYLASTCTSKDLSRPILTCVHIKDNGIIEAADGQQAIQIKNNSLLKNEFLLSNKIIAQLSKFQLTNIAIGNSYVHFKTNTTKFSCRMYKEKYPDLKDIFNIKGKELVLPKKLNEVINRARVFTLSPTILNELVTLKFEKDLLFVKAQNEYGKFEESIKVKHNLKNDLEFQVQPQVLQRMLSKDHLECMYNNNKLCFQSDNWKYIIYLHINNNKMDN
jgi:DNA polymerase III sliding clamp (beta) subunit (PCNA family)